MMRCFFGLPVPGSLAEAAKILADKYRNHPAMHNITWSPSANWHLTVRFLGQTTEEQRQKLVNEAHEIAKNIGPLELSSNGILIVPQRRPRVFCLSVRLNDSLAELFSVLHKMTVGCGFEPEPRPFLPHITLGRWNAPPQDPIDKLPQAEMTEVISEFHLYESEGGLYTPIETFKLN